MENTEILIIGAGAAGLMAAYQLSKTGKKVIVLEARNRTGGRIHTLDDVSFFKLVELGAEFVHGDLPVTLALLKEADIEPVSANAEMWRYAGGKFQKSGQFIEHWDEFITKINQLQDDIAIADFVNKEFAGAQYKGTRDSVWDFVSGYDTADPYKASAFALRKEWQNEDGYTQHRVTGGYCAMISFLVKQIRMNGGLVFLNAVTKKIDWQPGKVEATTVEGLKYSAGKMIIAMPLGVLQADKKEQGAISFSPEITEHAEAIGQMGFGAIIKVLLEFNEAFWEDEKYAEGINEMGYLFSEEEIPTWWTQYPNHSTVLTGWLGGPGATEKLHTPDEEILQQALTSVANIFQFNVTALKNKLIAWKVINWTADPFTRGSYAYDTVAAPDARKLINTPIENTIYFTGEYLYEGTAMGTVEAALTSGRDVAEKIK